MTPTTCSVITSISRHRRELTDGVCTTAPPNIVFGNIKEIVMTDYGHNLLFGTFITPVNQPPMQAVELAMVSDRAGLDLVTFQDHPYQPRFHDTWTLLSYVASRTKQIHVSSN